MSGHLSFDTIHRSRDIVTLVQRMRAFENALNGISPQQISTNTEAKQLRDVTMKFWLLKWQVQRLLLRKPVVAIPKPSALETGARLLILAIFYRYVSMRA